MKIILYESQINTLVLSEQVSTLLSKTLNEEKNLDILKKQIKKFIIRGIALATLIAGINALHISRIEKLELIELAKQEEMLQKQRQMADSLSNIKINACAQYMEKALNNQGFSMKSTNLSPEAIVKASEKHSFDLPLLIAAAHLESCFGATPRAQRTNSVYSVGSYDSGKNMTTYNHPNQSIEGYINLIKNDYLIDGKTIDDLLKPGGFINKNGHRYASKKNYETLLKSIRNKIIKNYPELV